MAVRCEGSESRWIKLAVSDAEPIIHNASDKLIKCCSRVSNAMKSKVRSSPDATTAPLLLDRECLSDFSHELISKFMKRSGKSVYFLLSSTPEQHHANL